MITSLSCMMRISSGIRSEARLAGLVALQDGVLPGPRTASKSGVAEAPAGTTFFARQGNLYF